MSTPQISAGTALTEGILLEANRQFFHRFGLALAAEWDDESDWDGPADRLVLLDYRGDPEGMAYDEGYLASPEMLAKHAAFVQKYTLPDRVKNLGYDVQPIIDQDKAQVASLAGRKSL